MLTQVMAMIYLAILSVMDAKKREIPLWLLALGMLPAVMAAVFGIWRGGRAWEELLMGLVPGMVLLCMAGLGKGAGAGDGIVLLQLGLFFSLEMAVMAFAISMIVISMFSLVLLLIKVARKETRLPYLPFLWLGCLGALTLFG